MDSEEVGHCFGKFVPGKSRPLMAMIEVTNRCNMFCPVCFSDARPRCQDVPFDKIRRSLEQLLEVTGTPVPIQISGGEPTVREDLAEIITLTRSLGFRHIELLTNGIEISKSADLLQKLKFSGLSAVYLQFDGLNKQTHLTIRGQDMTEVRDKAIQAVRQAGLCCTLAVTVLKGVNDNEIGNIVSFGIENTDTVRAINFQSATRFSGRFEMESHSSGYSLPELVRRIEAQTGVPARSFKSDHLGHPLCNAMSLVFPVNGKLEPLFNYVSSADVQAFLGENSREKILALFEGKREFFARHPANPYMRKMIVRAAPIFGSNLLNVLRSKHLLLFAKSFMERQGLSPERINNCCYAISGSDGVFSFCAFNNLYRYPQAGRPRRNYRSGSKP